MTSVSVTVTVSLEGFDIKGFIYIYIKYRIVRVGPPTSVSVTVTALEICFIHVPYSSYVVISPISNTFSDWRRTCHVPWVKTH